MSGTPQRPRLVLHRSLKNISAQIIDDTKSMVLFSFSTFAKDLRQKFPSAGNLKAAESFGHFFAKEARAKGITRIIFDRAGYLYHGRIKAFADAARKEGLEF